MSSRYDRAITVFSPDGHLFQVDYAREAVGKGSTAVGVRGQSVVVLCVEKKAIPKLQEERTVQKICVLDDQVMLSFAGLSADARVLIDRGRVECQSHKLTVEDPVSLEYITRFVAGMKQRYTQSSGMRPFGLACLLTGFDDDGTPRLYQTDPAGIYSEWKASAIGRSTKTVREFLEKNYSASVAADDYETVKLAIKALFEVVQQDGKNLEVAVMSRGKPMRLLKLAEVNNYIADIEKEKEQDAAKLKKEQEGKEK